MAFCMQFSCACPTWSNDEMYQGGIVKYQMGRCALTPSSRPKCGLLLSQPIKRQLTLEYRYHLDVNGPGTHALVSQAGGRAHLVGIQQTDHKGKIEQVYSMNGDSPGEQRQNFGAVFACGYRTVLFGSTESNLLVWNKIKGEVICGLDHGECGYSFLKRASTS